MLSMRDWRARVGKFLRMVTSRAAARAKGRSLRVAVGSEATGGTVPTAGEGETPVPTTIRLVAEDQWPTGVREALAQVGGRGEREHLRLATALLIGANVIPEEIGGALRSPGGPLGALMGLLELGERQNVWSDPIEGRGAAALALRSALAEMGEVDLLALGLARFTEKHGTEKVNQALAAVKAWHRGKRSSGDRKSNSGAQVVPIRPTGEPQIERQEDNLVDRLLQLNINQHRGRRLEGWYVPPSGEGEVGELYILRSKIDAHLKNTLDSEHLVKDVQGEARCRPDGTFVVRAGSKEYDGVFAVDLEAVHRLVGERFSELASMFDSRRNPKASSWTVRVVPEERPAEPGQECPACGAAMRKKGAGVGFWVCAASPKSCGFSVQGGEDGLPAPPKACEACGEPTFLTKKNRKKRWRHLDKGGCQGMKAAA